MVSFDAEKLKTLLYIDAHGGAASPDANDEIGAKAAVEDIGR